MPAPGIFDVLLEREAATPRCLLEEEYGAALLIDERRVAVNFVSTIDGVVSFGLEADDSRAVGGGVPADRVLMAMLRAIAGVIVVGAGTLRATRNHQWTAQALAADRGHDLAALRRAAGRPAQPAALLVVSARGNIPSYAVAISHPAVPVHVLTGDGLTAAVSGYGVQQAGEQVAAQLSAAVIVEAATALAGGGPILCEGGPHLLGSLLSGRVPVDLFLTVAPQLAGRGPDSAERLSLVEGAPFDAFTRPGALRSVRRSGDHLLLRYRVDSVVHDQS
jgi:riboflavin biosynthesis pyrimidine reductase